MHEPAKGSIALVDDEENIRETVGFALRREGFQVDVHADGRAAWERNSGALRLLPIRSSQCASVMLPTGVG